MFILTLNEFANNDQNNIREFIQSWGRHYVNNPPWAINRQGKKMDERIGYINELNIGNNLTEQNITRLLRWKMWRSYTHPRRSGERNARVVAILDKIRQLNDFRNNNLTEEQFMHIAEQLIPADGTMRIFLFHICRPCEYPIADRNVFRVFYRLTQNQRGEEVKWDTYRGENGYICFFEQLADGYCGDVDGLVLRAQQLKEIDDALMAFGQFLRKYDI